MILANYLLFMVVVWFLFFSLYVCMIYFVVVGK